jgi:hypothetical protein
VRWTQSPLGQYKALPKDGKPISEWVNQNTALLDVVTGLRQLLTAKPADAEPKAEDRPSDADRAQAAKLFGAERSRAQYRVPRDFDEIDRADFAAEAFATIRDHFQRSIREIDSIDGLRGRFREISGVAFAGERECDCASNSSR